MASDGMVLEGVDSEHHIHVLREYRKLLQSTMGPSGSCKALVTGGGYLEVMSSSTGLMARLELASPFCKYINNMAAGLADHGLYCGVLLSHLLEQQLQECTLSKNKMMHIIGVLVKELRTLLLSENVCIKLDFCSVKILLPLVRTIITSKCPVILPGMDVSGLCIEIIKVFLSCIDDETNSINRIYIKVESGPNFFTSYKGLLYTETEPRNIEIAREVTGYFKIVVFTLKLGDNDEDLFLVVHKVKQILEHLIQSGVRIVACQKTVAAEIKLFLRRRKIILLERMGSDFTKMLINISQAFPVSNLLIEESEVVKLTGNLSSVKHINFNESDYLVLNNEQVPVGTLLVQSCSLLGENSGKVLIQQALTALRSVAVHPLLTLGGGCLETWIIGEIHQLKESWREQEFHLVSAWVQRSLRSTCSAVEMDTLYHHGWREGVNKCNCGLVGREKVEQGGGTWLILQEVVSSQVSLQSPLQPDTTHLHPDVLVESHQQKLQVICAVFEAFANLSNVGLVVYES